jgi:hypothetical protein
MTTRISAGDLSKKAVSDHTDYNVLELGYAVTADVDAQLRISIEKHKPIFDEEEFCVVRVAASDCLIKTLKRYKYYCWPYLPSPRPDQAVFLYNKSLDKITKRLWVLPSAARMAQLATTMTFVPKEYQTMQAWSVAFFKGTFWDFIRHQHDINMPSEHEFFLAHREELIKAGGQIPDANFSDPFDFSKIAVEKIIDTKEALIN